MRQQRLDGANRWQTDVAHHPSKHSADDRRSLFILAVSGLLGSNFDQIFMLKNNMNLRMAESLDLLYLQHGACLRKAFLLHGGSLREINRCAGIALAGESGVEAFDGRGIF